MKHNIGLYKPDPGSRVTSCLGFHRAESVLLFARGSGSASRRGGKRHAAPGESLIAERAADSTAETIAARTRRARPALGLSGRASAEDAYLLQASYRAEHFHHAIYRRWPKLRPIPLLSFIPVPVLHHINFGNAPESWPWPSLRTSLA